MVERPASDHAAGVSELDKHRFDLSVKIGRVFAALPSDPGLFIAAEGRTRVSLSVTVDPHESGFETSRNLVRAADIAGPNAGAKAVGGIVALKDRVVLVAERNQRRYRTKDLLLGDAHLIAHIDKDGGLDEIAAR